MDKELYILITDKIIKAVKTQKEINPNLFSLSVSYNTNEINEFVILEIKNILLTEKITLISFHSDAEITVFNIAYT